jgi:hypothetical protein
MEPAPHLNLLEMKESIGEKTDFYKSENVWMVVAHDV